MNTSPSEPICNTLHGSSPTIEDTEMHIKYVQVYVTMYFVHELIKYAEIKGVLPEDAIDMVHEVVANELRKQIIKGFSCSDDCDECSGRALEKWLFSVVSRRIKNYFSRVKNLPVNVDDYAHVLHTVDMPTDLDEMAHDLSAPFFHPDDEINEGQLRYVDAQTQLDRELHKAIQKLTKRERQYVISRYFRGAENSREAAEMMGITHVNARKIKQRVMRKLRLDLGSFF